ncbi:hypothetical protein DZ860_00855 [Vibrio sinensis]|uniref:OmpG family monomeric porin n=1 Tax=Vibrio sinensis TaxID=2302434 RepID=A0A3A6QXK5_9VIBR|nr:hypothetical protein [Vibrio sinensis]RJX75266.1 hypothetical protein DZ860_00855 [Vibrio sinensis]
MKRNALALAMLGVLFTAPTIARTIVEVGTEYDHYFNEVDINGKPQNYAMNNAVVPYIRFTHAPNDQSWNMWGRYFKKIYTEENLFPTGVTSGMTDRYELHAFKVDRSGDLRTRFGVGVRHNDYESDRRETEYRFYPQFDYFVNSTNQFFLNGHVYFGDSKGKRSTDKVEEDYVDWGYEAEFGLIHRLSPTALIKPTFFTEFDSFENNYDVDYWQFRLVYTQKIGRATINPFVRVGLGRDVQEKSHYDYSRWGTTMDKNYSRAGIYGNIGISGKLNFIYETYWQVEDNSYYDANAGEIKSLPDRDKFFAKVGMQYVF